MNREQVAQCLRGAAEVIDDGIEAYACHALGRTAWDSPMGTMRDASLVLSSWFWPQPGDKWGYTDGAARVIALLLAAEIVETEDAP